ncbi:hypothetical protein DERF_015889 [Dermatophagoides farinae]|uniref:Uncharacterized protein n=1 Tax=Dermatophagoides farinae TaxID=6954 RepID=A0A922KY91_DERFA|nr:hypothetical protein DERF_015889 [Dermatophagoides farinae]
MESIMPKTTTTTTVVVAVPLLDMVKPQPPPPLSSIKVNHQTSKMNTGKPKNKMTKRKLLVVQDFESIYEWREEARKTCLTS